MLEICAVNEKLSCEAVLCGSREQTQDPEIEGSSLSPIFDCVSSHPSLPSTVACCYATLYEEFFHGPEGRRGLDSVDGCVKGLVVEVGASGLKRGKKSFLCSPVLVCL